MDRYFKKMDLSRLTPADRRAFIKFCKEQRLSLKPWPWTDEKFEILTDLISQAIEKMHAHYDKHGFKLSGMPEEIYKAVEHGMFFEVSDCIVKYNNFDYSLGVKIWKKL